MTTESGFLRVVLPTVDPMSGSHIRIALSMSTLVVHHTTIVYTCQHILYGWSSHYHLCFSCHISFILLNYLDLHHSAFFISLYKYSLCLVMISCIISFIYTMNLFSQSKFTCFFFATKVCNVIKTLDICDSIGMKIHWFKSR